MPRKMIIAPCGMNCSLCLAYQRDRTSKNATCPGCTGTDTGKPKYCARCSIKLCSKRAKNKTNYCSSDCEIYPCPRLKRLDKRYRAKYGMSMLENLGLIESKGIRTFLKIERKKRACSRCGTLICVHIRACMNCGAPAQNAARS